MLVLRHENKCKRRAAALGKKITNNFFQPYKADSGGWMQVAHVPYIVLKLKRSHSHSMDFTALSAGVWLKFKFIPWLPYTVVAPTTRALSSSPIKIHSLPTCNSQWFPNLLTEMSGWAELAHQSTSTQWSTFKRTKFHFELIQVQIFRTGWEFPQKLREVP